MLDRNTKDVLITTLNSLLGANITDIATNSIEWQLEFGSHDEALSFEENALSLLGKDSSNSSSSSNSNSNVRNNKFRISDEDFRTLLLLWDIQIPEIEKPSHNTFALSNSSSSMSMSLSQTYTPITSIEKYEALRRLSVKINITVQNIEIDHHNEEFKLFLANKEFASNKANLIKVAKDMNFSINFSIGEDTTRFTITIDEAKTIFERLGIEQTDIDLLMESDTNNRANSSQINSFLAVSNYSQPSLFSIKGDHKLNAINRLNHSPYKVPIQASPIYTTTTTSLSNLTSVASTPSSLVYENRIDDADKARLLITNDEKVVNEFLIFRTLFKSKNFTCTDIINISFNETKDSINLHCKTIEARDHLRKHIYQNYILTPDVGFDINNGAFLTLNFSDVKAIAISNDYDADKFSNISSPTKRKMSNNYIDTRKNWAGINSNNIAITEINRICKCFLSEIIKVESKVHFRFCNTENIDKFTALVTDKVGINYNECIVSIPITNIPDLLDKLLEKHAEPKLRDAISSIIH